MSKKQDNLISKIVCTYTDDYDITLVHDIITKALSNEKQLLPSLTDKLDMLKLLQQKPQTFNAKKETLAEIQSIEAEIDRVNKLTKLHDYLQLSQPLIEQYRMLKFNNESTLKVIDQYLKMAKQYYTIHITRQMNVHDCCVNCKKPLDYQINVANGMIKCPHCLNEHQLLNTTKSNEGQKIQNMNTENDMDNFVKALLRYQGLQHNPPTIIYQKLDTYFKQRGKPTSNDIKSMPYNDKGKKGNTNKEMLCQALSHIGYASYYEDVNLIGHIYWDWKLPDLTNLKDTILRHYQMTQKSFYKIPFDVRGRISSLGTQYRLWRHLQLVGHICDMDEFKIAENNDSLQNHHRLWRMMCEISNDPEIYYID
ncbi:MAG TPA: hypothetical protein VLG50_08005 [Candidatus Saccharimonadales bacterium]|nr:hypothetical protein [Candidatus Saccharimonadales bacterium]